MTMTSIDSVDIDYSDQRERLEPPPGPQYRYFPGGIWMCLAQGYTATWWNFYEAVDIPDSEVVTLVGSVNAEVAWSREHGTTGGQHRRGGLQDVALFVSDY